MSNLPTKHSLGSTPQVGIGRSQTVPRGLNHLATKSPTLPAFTGMSAVLTLFVLPRTFYCYFIEIGLHQDSPSSTL